MNREQRRAAFAAAEQHPHAQKCHCGWLMPRELFVEQLFDLRDGKTAGPPARIRMVIICPVCGTRADVEVGRSALA